MHVLEPPKGAPSSPHPPPVRHLHPTIAASILVQIPQMRFFLTST
jgi:hypothetical protein